jgi:hypothetical protein
LRCHPVSMSVHIFLLCEIIKCLDLREKEKNQFTTENGLLLCTHHRGAKGDVLRIVPIIYAKSKGTCMLMNLFSMSTVASDSFWVFNTAGRKPCWAHISWATAHLALLSKINGNGDRKRVDVPTWKKPGPALSLQVRKDRGTRPYKAHLKQNNININLTHDLRRLSVVYLYSA